MKKLLDKIFKPLTTAIISKNCAIQVEGKEELTFLMVAHDYEDRVNQVANEMLELLSGDGDEPFEGACYCGTMPADSDIPCDYCCQLAQYRARENTLRAAELAELEALAEEYIKYDQSVCCMALRRKLLAIIDKRKEVDNE